MPDTLCKGTMKQPSSKNLTPLLKVLGPGLLFASTAIGTSHLVLATRAGAHHGMIFFWIILGSLIFKYPFFEFGVRYTHGTGKTLLQGYREQGKWAVILFLGVISITMFAVTGAVAAVCGGLLSSMFGMSGIPMPFLVGGILTLTAMLLLIGRFSALDHLIKLISIFLLLAVSIAFIAVLIKGPVDPVTDLTSAHNLLEGPGLALTISLIGFMPTGLEVSVFSSIWMVEKIRSSHYHPTLRESLFDFNLGYLFTTVLALMFMTIGAFTVFGTGQLLEGNSTEFSNKLLSIFTNQLGKWTSPVIAIAAFGTIYGTLITAWDAFARSFIRGVQIFKFDKMDGGEGQEKFLSRWYNILLPIIGIGGFILFYQFKGGMIKILEAVTIIVFLVAPVIAWLNIRVIQSDNIPKSHRVSKSMLILAYAGLIMMVVFSIYYLTMI